VTAKRAARRTTRAKTSENQVNQQTNLLESGKIIQIPLNTKAPACSPYFETLRIIVWICAGLPNKASPVSNVTPAERYLLYTDFQPLKRVLLKRLYGVDVFLKHERIVKAALDRGSSQTDALEQAKAMTVITLIQDAKEEGVNCDENYVEGVLRNYDNRMRYARRWKELIDIFNSLEIMLICYEEEEELEENYRINISKIVLDGGDSQFNMLKVQLELRYLDLRETCCRLSGIVDAIQKLLPLSGDSELRKHLAGDISSRIHCVFGPLSDSDDDSSETDTSSETEQPTQYEPVAEALDGGVNDGGAADAARYMSTVGHGSNDIMDIAMDLLSYVPHSTAPSGLGTM
jgi:hypothetical protein